MLRNSVEHSVEDFLLELGVSTWRSLSAELFGYALFHFFTEAEYFGHGGGGYIKCDNALLSTVY